MQKYKRKELGRDLSDLNYLYHEREIKLHLKIFTYFLIYDDILLICKWYLFLIQLKRYIFIECLCNVIDPVLYNLLYHKSELFRSYHSALRCAVVTITHKRAEYIVYAISTALCSFLRFVRLLPYFEATSARRTFILTSMMYYPSVATSRVVWCRSTVTCSFRRCLFFHPYHLASVFFLWKHPYLTLSLGLSVDDICW